MKYWIEITTIAANLVTALGIIGFALFYFTHQQNQRQFKFQVMLSCIERFQKLFPLIRDGNGDMVRLKRYIDLTSEEFFYFQRRYIPEVVIVEWMDSIIDSFPIYIEGSELPFNYQNSLAKLLHDENLLKGYPRLKAAFRLKLGVDTSNRKMIIMQVANNLKIRLKLKHFEGAMILD